MDEGQGLCGLLIGLVPRVVVAKYKDNTPRNKKSYDPGTSLRTGTADAAAPIAIPLPFFFQKKKNGKFSTEFLKKAQHSKVENVAGSV
jgi:hypothetical protein